MLHDYDRRCEAIRVANRDLLDAFRSWLGAKGLSDSTVSRHVKYADLYVNHYLLYEEPIKTPAQGASGCGMFLDYWFPRKVSEREGALASGAVALRKLYQFLHERDEITGSALQNLNRTSRSRSASARQRLRARS